MMEEWQKLDEAEKKPLIEEINAKVTPAPFDPGTAGLRRHRLDFYPEYDLYEISDHAVAQGLRKYALRKPGNVVMLDWTNQPIYETNRAAPIRLTDLNVTDYLKFFFSYVRGRHGRFVIVEHVDEISWQIEPPPQGRKALQDMIAPVTLVARDADGTYHLECFMIFKDSLFKTKAQVQKDGLVTLSEEELKIEGMPVVEDKAGAL